MKNKEEILVDINNFEMIFNDYYKSFSEYLDGGFIPDSLYKFGHPTLFENAIKLQMAFFKLPKQVRDRLFLLDFEVFLHCNNVIDFYNLRIFLLKKSRFERTATIAVRVDAEIKLALEFVQNDIFDEYINLPQPNFRFYREYSSQFSLLTELEREIEELNDSEDELKNKQEVAGLNPKEDDNKDDFVKSQDNIFDEITNKIKKGEEIVDTSENFLGKSISLIKRIIEFKELF